MPSKKRPSHYKPADETTRTTEAILLRVQPEVARAFEALVAEDGGTKAETFAMLVKKERARRDRR